MNENPANVDPSETGRFDRLAARWWDANADSRALHDINPARVGYITARLHVPGARIADVGCGGGILSEALAAAGAVVTGIDRAPRVLEVARLHLHESGLRVDYLETDAEQLAAERPATFDAVTCMELVEHVPDPGSLIDACARLLKPGGRLFVSTLTRTPVAFAGAIIGAEYLLGLLPRGTHHYASFLRPSELAALLRRAGLVLDDVSALSYNPLTRKASVGGQVMVNYLATAAKPA